MVGVLGLQGDFEAHRRMVENAGATATIVKKPEQLAELKGLVIPGGESTTLIRLIEIYNFWAPLRQFAQAGHAVLGTCAGMILLAREVKKPAQKSLGVIDLAVERNSYGRQRESFGATGTFTGADKPMELPMVFIRAPRIRRLGAGVAPLAFWQDECVMAQQGNVLVAAFHPELTADLTVHRYFLEQIR